MKINKVLMIIQTIGMYLSQIPIIAIFVIAAIDKNNELDNLFDIFGNILWISMVVVTLLCAINIVCGFLSILKPPQDLSKITFILKIVHVP